MNRRIFVLLILPAALMPASCALPWQPAPPVSVVRVGMPLVEAQAALASWGARQDDMAARRPAPPPGAEQMDLPYTLPSGCWLLVFARKQPKGDFVVTALVLDRKSHLRPPASKQEAAANLEPVEHIDLSKLAR